MLKKTARGTGCKGRGLPRSRQIDAIGEEVSAAQRRRPPAQQFIQRFLCYAVATGLTFAGLPS